MEGPGETTVVRPRRSRGVFRVFETVAVWLVIIGLFAGLAYGVSLAVHDGVGRIDELIAQAQTRTSVAYSVEPVEAAVEEPVVAPGIGEAPSRAPTDLLEVVREVPPRWIAVPNPHCPMTGGAMVEGSVALLCSVTTEGRLTGCEILEESPAGRGFGAAALEATGGARLTPRTLNGEPTPAEVRFSVRFTPG